MYVDIKDILKKDFDCGNRSIEKQARKTYSELEKLEKKKAKKNISQKIKNGTIIMTRDEFLEDNNGYEKPKYKNKKDVLYRETVTVDSNRNDELALIKIHSGGKLEVKNNAGQKEKYSPFIKTKDNEGKPIKVGQKFQVGNEKYNISEHNANKMKKEALKNTSRSLAKENRQFLKDLKKRK